ncbi:MAG: hypothetical protein Q8878_05040 [Bacillota bacterium]|nr:hypothetical protein [Bacillota bacterium]
MFYFFMLGFLMIFTNTAVLIAESLGGTAFKPVFLFPAAAFLFLLIYALFFALPFGDTYSVHQKNVICKTGPYAMCRHPGVICFAGFYLFLYFALPSLRLAYFATVSCICNLLYVIFQDMWSFPLTFDGYGDYRNETPFLIPTAKSIRRGLQTLRNRSFSKHEP